MSLFRSLARVRDARAEMESARLELHPPSAALLARGRRYPLATVGVAAGAGVVLGRLNVHPLHIPGLGKLLSGGMAEAVALGTRVIAELGLAGAAANAEEDGELAERAGFDRRPAG